MGAQALGPVQKTPNQVSHEISSAESKVPSGGSARYGFIVPTWTSRRQSTGRGQCGQWSWF